MVAPLLEQLASEYAGRLKIAKLNGEGDVLKYSNNSIVRMTTRFFRYILSSFYRMFQEKTHQNYMIIQRYQ